MVDTPDEASSPRSGFFSNVLSNSHPNQMSASRLIEYSGRFVKLNDVLHAGTVPIFTFQRLWKSTVLREMSANLLPMTRGVTAGHSN